MIEANIDGGQVELKITGDLRTLAAESGMLINGIFQALPEDAREPFKFMMVGMFNDENSPVWKMSDPLEGSEKVVIDLSRFPGI